MPTAISLDAAVVITDLSKRTIWRRMSDGSIGKVSDSGQRAMIAFEDIETLLVLSMSAEDRRILLKADAGDAEAQDDMGQLFLAAGRFDAARYWLELAARQDYPNAMQTLGRCYLAGDCVPRDENLGVMWIAKAAAMGHTIAQAQMRAFRGAVCAP